MGLPIVYGYIDTDLKGNEPFALRIDVKDSLLDWNKIINFLERLPEKTEIRQWAKTNIDLLLKVSQLDEFLMNLN